MKNNKDWLGDHVLAKTHNTSNSISIEQLCEELKFHLHLHDIKMPVTLHRVSSFGGYVCHTSYTMGYGINYIDAEFFLEEKWYPGHNDYPFGKDFDYEQEGFKIISEWISGTFVQEI